MDIKDEYEMEFEMEFDEKNDESEVKEAEQIDSSSE